MAIRDMNGWIKLHRKLLTWGWFRDSETVHLFMYLLLSANSEPGDFMGHEIGRGQVAVGYPSISAATGISVKAIRTRMDRLIKSGEISKKTGRLFTVVTINNYDNYQLSASDMGRKRAGKGQEKGNK